MPPIEPSLPRTTAPQTVPPSYLIYTTISDLTPANPPLRRAQHLPTTWCRLRCNHYTHSQFSWVWYVVSFSLPRCFLPKNPHRIPRTTIDVYRYLLPSYPLFDRPLDLLLDLLVYPQTNDPLICATTTTHSFAVT